MNRILEIENDGAGPVQQGVDEVLGLGAWKIQARAAQAISGRWYRQSDLFGRRLASEPQPTTPGGSFNPRRNYERQGALVAQFNPGVLDAKHLQHLPCLRHYGLALVGRDPGVHRDLEASAVARLDGHVQIGADIPAAMSGLA